MDIEQEFLHLGRLALAGQLDDVKTLLRRARKNVVTRRPDLADEYDALIRGKGNPSRTAGAAFALPLPVDQDSRLELLRKDLPAENPVEPIWPAQVHQELRETIAERRRSKELLAAGLTPTRSVLFVGPPGVGKTLAAQWLANQTGRPLLTLDLAAVMSSFLGKTGTNIRSVLNYAQLQPSVLLLDEFDAIAKRRDDETELGELKRLVTVLLQSVDDWPSDGFLVAATNHPELLDPAIWRRFDRVIKFPYPSSNDLAIAISNLVNPDIDGEMKNRVELLSVLFEGLSYSEVTRRINQTRRQALINSIPIENALDLLIATEASQVDKVKKYQWVPKLISIGFNQTEVSNLLGISRPTVKKYMNKDGEIDGE